LIKKKIFYVEENFWQKEVFECQNILQYVTFTYLFIHSSEISGQTMEADSLSSVSMSKGFRKLGDAAAKISLEIELHYQFFLEFFNREWNSS